jgi:hypothetical protein
MSGRRHQNRRGRLVMSCVIISSSKKRIISRRPPHGST